VDVGNNVWHKIAACIFCGKTRELEIFHIIWAGQTGDLYIDTFLSVANIT
jgi:hypothetical protein